jgi:pyrophosphatase PpaX
MKKYDYFLFDWDGCLADTLPVWIRAYKKTFQSFGMKISKEEIVEEALGSWTSFEKFGIQKEQKDKFVNLLVNNSLQELQEVELFNGVKKVLKRIKREGKKSAIVTTSKKISIKPALLQHNLYKFLDVLVTIDDVEKGKPNPEPLKKALAEMNGAKKKAVMIGDSDKDVQAGKNFGIETILFHPEENEKIYTERMIKKINPTYFITDFNDLLQLI